MKKKTKRILSMLLCMLLLCAAVPMQASAETYRGGYGYVTGYDETGVMRWELDTSTGLFTISGIGGMADWNVTSEINVPWYGYRSSIKTVTIGSGITHIGGWVFYDCENLVRVTIPESVTSIGDYAFGRCTSLSDVAIPDSVTEIGDGAFHNTAFSNDASNWTGDGLYFGHHLIEVKDSVSGKFTVKDGTIYIADGAFDYCENLTGVAIPASVTSIGDGAFAGCTNLASVTIPDSVTHIGFHIMGFYDMYYDYDTATAFYKNGNNWKNGVLYCGHHVIKCAENYSGNLTIEDGTRCIADYAFQYCENMTGVAIPDTVTHIGDYAFANCEALASVVFSDGLTHIGEYAFVGCELSSVMIPRNVREIGLGAFICYYEVDNDYYPTMTLQKIDADPDNAYFSSKDGVLYNKAQTALVQYPAGLQNTAFSIPDGVARIEPLAFGECLNLRKVSFPQTLRTIGRMAFFSCALEDVSFVDGVQTIGELAFTYCAFLNDIAFPDSVTKIGYGALEGTAYAEDDNNWKDGALYCGHHLIGLGSDADTYVIADGTRCIAQGAFSYSNLKQVTIPKSVKNINMMAFGDTALEKVTYLGSQARWDTIHIDLFNEPLLEAERSVMPPLTLDTQSVTVYFKDTKTLTASRGDVVWSSDNEKAVKIDATGKLTAVGTGKAVITAADEDGVESVTCEVTVKYSFVQWLIRIFLFGWIWYK